MFKDDTSTNTFVISSLYVHIQESVNEIVADIVLCRFSILRYDGMSKSNSMLRRPQCKPQELPGRFTTSDRARGYRYSLIVY